MVRYISHMGYIRRAGGSAVGGPYYRAITSIDALALIETPAADGAAEGGSILARKATARGAFEPGLTSEKPLNRAAFPDGDGQ